MRLKSLLCGSVCLALTAGTGMATERVVTTDGNIILVQGAQGPQAPQAPQAPGAQPSPFDQAAPSFDSAPSDGGGDLGSGASAADSSAGIIGRGDANNRFNLFDNFSAIPRNQVWFAFQRQEGYQTFVQPFRNTSGSQTTNQNFVNNNIASRRDVYLYRAGAELKLSERASVLFQGGYIANQDTNFAGDSWYNPEFAVKYALVASDCTYVTATLGFQPQTSISDGELREVGTRIYPGLLVYRELSENLLFQGGSQFGFNTSDLPVTFDWALSLGYWVAKPCEDRRFGLLPMVELFGAHVLANQGSSPYNTNIGNGFSGTSYNYLSAKNVLDVTAGARFFWGERVSTGLGYSFPVTGAELRRSEFIASLNIAF